ncbi:MAG: FliM/FliN family flagellar motor switch protein [Deltaproteobacteria bacterium]|nr:FliM/FliN family flagellar motor switch protein [Deltaproteobacteria bacterium]
MTEPILNPEEIQDLLKEPTPVGEIGRLWNGETISYDLLQSGAKNEEQLEKLVAVQTPAAAAMAKGMKEWSGLPLTVTFSAHQLVPMSDVIAEVSLDRTLFAVWSDTAQGLSGAVLLDRALFFRLFTAMLGGAGSGERTGALTALERAFLDRFLAHIFGPLTEVWQRVRTIDFAVQEILIQQAQLGALGWHFDGIKAVLTAQVDGEPQPAGTITLLLPRELLTAMSDMGAVSEEAAQEKAQLDRQWQGAVHGAIGGTPVPIAVELGTTRASMERVLKLAVGDELPLQLSEAGHPVLVNGHVVFQATIGTVNGQRAIKIV